MMKDGEAPKCVTESSGEAGGPPTDDHHHDKYSAAIPSLYYQTTLDTVAIPPFFV
jgi:hypothetical protein